ncbi:MAG: GreA/GreB family elongation factor [Clostridia bacterium]|nr:GreA/GreB family elongation factor [Clostridia bacterium]
MVNSKVMSKAGYDKIMTQISEIEEEISLTEKKMGESVKRDNDLRENPEFLELRVKVMYTLPIKKKELLDIAKNAIILEETEEYKDFDGLKVIIGSKVVLTIDGEEEELTIMGYGEADWDNNIISYEAPMAQAILGKHVGDVVKFNSLEICIKAISRK